jgi:hypothetical protein
MARKEIEVEVKAAEATVATTEMNMDVMKDMEDYDNTFVPAVRGAMFEPGIIDGELSAANFRLPRIRIASGMGKLADSFQKGDIVLADKYKIAAKGIPVRLIIIKMETYWHKYVSSEEYKITGYQQQERYKTEQDVLNAGGKLVWEGKRGPTHQQAMELQLLVEKPEGVDCSEFGLSLGGKQYAVASWTLENQAFKAAGPDIYRVARFSLSKRGLLSGLFEVFTIMKPLKQGTTVAIPMFSLLPTHNSDELVAEIRALFGA